MMAHEPFSLQASICAMLFEKLPSADSDVRA